MVASFLAPATIALFQVFFWSSRRTKTPKGLSLRLKCCAASQSNDLARDEPALVICWVYRHKGMRISRTSHLSKNETCRRTGERERGIGTFRASKHHHLTLNKCFGSVSFTIRHCPIPVGKTKRTLPNSDFLSCCMTRIKSSELYSEGQSTGNPNFS